MNNNVETIPSADVSPTWLGATIEELSSILLLAL